MHAHICTHTGIHTLTRTHARTCMHKDTHTHAHARRCTHTHTHTHTNRADNRQSIKPTCDCLQDLGRKRREEEEEEEEAVGADFEPWSAKRGEILARFTTTEKLSIVSIYRCSNSETFINSQLEWLTLSVVIDVWTKMSNLIVLF